MLEKFIFYVLTGLCISLALSYLNKATGKKVTANQQGEYLLRMHKFYYVLGVISVIIGTVFLVVPPLVDDVDIVMLIVIFFMLLIFGGLGLLCLLYYKNHYLLFDSNRIEVRSHIGKTSSIHWDDIKRAQFNAFSGLLILTTYSGGKLKIHQHLVGLVQFVNQLEERKGWTPQDLKLPINRGG